MRFVHVLLATVTLVLALIAAPQRAIEIDLEGCVAGRARRRPLGTARMGFEITATEM